LTHHNRKLEEEIERRMIRQKEINLELKRSNIDLQQFAYVASHDLQEPLRMIGNFIQLLERKYGERLEDDGRQFISFAVDGVNRMSKLIKNLLEFSQVGHQSLDFEPADMNEIVNNKVLDLYQRIIEKKACIDMHVLPESLNCVPNQLGIVKRIINRHKGRIWFESQVGEGTTFYFTISKSLVCEQISN